MVSRVLASFLGSLSSVDNRFIQETIGFVLCKEHEMEALSRGRNVNIRKEKKRREPYPQKWTYIVTENKGN